MKKYEILIVSPTTDYKLQISNILDTINLTTVFNNKESLAKIYNSFLKQVRLNTEKPEFIIFMHHDVNLDIFQLIHDLDIIKNKYDVIGLCGTEVLNVSQSPLNWFTGSAQTPNKRWGCVTHGEVNSQSFYNIDRANIKDHSVACIDGLCIIFGQNAINSQLKFDEQFYFDQYDTDISLQTILNYKMKLGVIVEKSLQHYSIGKSILSEEFLKHEKDFRKKWKIELN